MPRKPHSVCVPTGEGEKTYFKEIGVFWPADEGKSYVMKGTLHMFEKDVFVFPPKETRKSYDRDDSTGYAPGTPEPPSW